MYKHQQIGNFRAKGIIGNKKNIQFYGRIREVSIIHSILSAKIIFDGIILSYKW